MGESREARRPDRARSRASPHPESVPINMLVQVEGTPLAGTAKLLDPLEFVRTIAVARITHAEVDGAAVRGARGR
jgi:biotin synthase